MLKERRLAGDQVSAALFSAEASMAQTIEKVADLVRLIQVAQAGANLSPVVAVDVANRAIFSLRALGDANKELVEAHHGLAEVQRRVGLGAVAFGTGGGQKPDDSSITVARGPVAA